MKMGSLFLCAYFCFLLIRAKVISAYINAENRSIFMVKSSVGYTMHSMWNTVSDYCAEKIQLKGLILVVLFAGCGAALYFGYRWYDTRKQVDAQFAFGVLLDQYNAASEQDGADFTSFANEFARGYEDHKNTVLAPYFLSFQADSLIKAGNKSEALAVVDKAVQTQSSPSFVNLFKTKRALLALDGADKEREKQALDELQLLAQDDTNSHRDYALYNLGMYHWVNDNVEAARVAWQELVNMQTGNVFSDSPWAALVADQLQSIS